MPSTKRAGGALASTTTERKRTANLCVAIGRWCDLPGSDGAVGGFDWLLLTSLSIGLISNHKAKMHNRSLFFPRFCFTWTCKCGKYKHCLKVKRACLPSKRAFCICLCSFFNASVTPTEVTDRKGSTTYFGIWRNVQEPGNTQRVIHSVLDMAQLATLPLYRHQKWLLFLSTRTLVPWSDNKVDTAAVRSWSCYIKTSKRIMPGEWGAAANVSLLEQRAADCACVTTLNVHMARGFRPYLQSCEGLNEPWMIWFLIFTHMTPI